MWSTCSCACSILNQYFSGLYSFCVCLQIIFRTKEIDALKRGFFIFFFFQFKKCLEDLKPHPPGLTIVKGLVCLLDLSLCQQADICSQRASFKILFLWNQHPAQPVLLQFAFQNVIASLPFHVRSASLRGLLLLPEAAGGLGALGIFAHVPLCGAVGFQRQEPWQRDRCVSYI